MSAHRCIRCQKEEKPDSWMWYKWLPQPGEDEGSEYWVLCDPCDTTLTRAAFEAEVESAAPLPGDWHQAAGSDLLLIIQLVTCPRCKVLRYIPCTSPKSPVVVHYVHKERLDAAQAAGWALPGDAPNESSVK